MIACTRDAEAVQVSAIDRHGRWSTGVGVRVVHAVGEGDAVPIGRSPLIPSLLRPKDLHQRVHLVTCLVEGVLLQGMLAGASALEPASVRRVVPHPAALGFEDQHPVARVGDHEVRFALFGLTAFGQHPVDGVVDHVLVTQLLEESLVEATLGRTRGRKHRERNHARHAAMLVHDRSASDWTSRCGGRTILARQPSSHVTYGIGPHHPSRRPRSRIRSAREPAQLRTAPDPLVGGGDRRPRPAGDPRAGQVRRGVGGRDPWWLPTCCWWRSCG